MSKFFKIANIELFILIFFGIIIICVILVEYFLQGLISNHINKLIFNDNQEDQTITIAYPINFPTLDPLSFDSVERSILSNVFEPLVKFDAYLEIKPALASSWGLLDDHKTWEFKLRQKVKFNNDENFTAVNVVNTFNTIKKSSSDLKNFISNINQIEIIDDYNLNFILKTEDPFFLSKLSTILIFLSGPNNQYYGTGAYSIDSYTNDTVKLTVNNNYYDIKPNFQNMIFTTIRAPEERLKTLEKDTADIVVNLPVNFPDSLISQSKVEVISFPALINYFLGFNTQNNYLSNLNIRKAIILSIDKTQIAALAASNIAEANQFSSPGVFGFNPNIGETKVNLDLAKIMMEKETAYKRISLNLDLPVGLEAVGDYLKNEFFKIGLDLNLNYHSEDDLLDVIKKGQTELYLLAWKHELGDMNDFYINMVHSRSNNFGTYNANYYNNKTVDQLIETAEKTIDDKKRQKMFQDVMTYIVEKDPFGLPLFNAKIIYGVSHKIKFQPRYDGYIIGSEIGLNELK
ncbi:hypothetical protein A2307_05525 [Candidatus Peregrinibacteria bacterium RIFOXYB2_FULL_33_20]|nr:MAG: hypothetical protein A2263_03930 [Candidatus Peregrinibacteria bacterium RIFOXYA2_FULL_33_21]OGJ50991.1 MAG: hypothetical protein A2307_05525 [Candidatus Peregrinibacteria bacterium RIFOXYB2_FULL_33_20]